jgi:multidrug resistance efflux pump
MQQKPMAVSPPDSHGAPIAILPVSSGAAPISGDANMLASLLQFEAEIRRQPGVAELHYHVVNELRRILPYEQMFIARQPRIGDDFHIVCASSISAVDRNAPLIQAMEKLIAKLAENDGLDRPHDFSLGAMSEDPALAEYPYGECRWQPLLDSEEKVFGGLLVMRETPFREGEGYRLTRLSETVSHSWRALTGDKPVKRIGRFGRKEKIGVMVALLVIALFPVRMTAMAPVEVVAARPFMVAAPFSGVISRIHVAPNAAVEEGALLVSFDDVKLSNELKLAQEKLAVAKARVDRSTSTAFGEDDETREIATLRAEYELAQADYNFANDVMALSQIKAPRAGMAIYSDRRDWEGRAVNVGDPILQVADPGQIALRIDLPAAEQMALDRGSRVKVWLDAQPLWAIEGKVEHASYQARQTAEGILAFAVTAQPTSGNPRIGSRGTAKLYGEWVPLIYSLLKRPIASFRQTIGL